MVAVGTLTQRSRNDARGLRLRLYESWRRHSDLMFHSLINSMWVLKQCMDSWAAQAGGRGRLKRLSTAAAHDQSTGLLDMDAETLMLDTKCHSALTRN